MEEAHVTITVKPIHIERAAYWIVILGLAILLVLAFMKDETCEPGTATVKDDANNANAAVPVVPTPTTPTATASCTDGIKNQAESDIDCGGTCGVCVTGKMCTVSADCASTFCTAGVCTASAPVALSGKIAIDVIKATLSPKTASDTVKVVSIEYKVTNGDEEDIDGYVIKVFVKNKAGTRCLNQEVQGTCDQPYAEFSSSRAVASGKDSGLQTQLFADLEAARMGRYLIEDNGYEPSDASLDDVQVIAYLYDSAGNAIGGKIITDSVAVSP